MMDGMMKEKDRIRKGLTEFLEAYYDGSFAQMARDYIRSTGMTSEEVEELQETMKKNYRT